jgi:hypothetical protein
VIIHILNCTSKILARKKTWRLMMNRKRNINPSMSSIFFSPNTGKSKNPAMKRIIRMAKKVNRIFLINPEGFTK